MSGLEVAKALFLKYSGSKFHMQREGEYGLYSSFNVTQAQERIWAEELQHNLLGSISVETDAMRIRYLVAELRSSFSAYKNPDIIAKVFEAILGKKLILDSFSKLLIAEISADLIRRLGWDSQDEIILQGKRIVLDLIQSVLDNPITVAPGYWELDHLAGDLTEEKLRWRAAQDLERYQKL